MTANQIYKYFVGNPERYIIWRGGWVSEQLPITNALIIKHLRHEIAIGSYPIYTNGSGDEYCKWICIDVDAHDEPDELPYWYGQLKELYGDLIFIEEVPYESMILEFSGGGYHLWILLEDKTPLELANKFIYHLRDLYLKSLDFGAVVEIFPKQATTVHLKKGIGNAVRLPCGKNLGKGVVSKIKRGNLNIIKPYNLERYKNIEIPERYSVNGYCTPRTSMEIFNAMEVDEELDFWLEFPLKPCIKMVISGETQCHSLGQVGHKIRMAVVHECRYYGMPLDTIVKCFSNQMDFDPEKTTTQVMSVIESSNRKDGRYSCSKIDEMGFCHKNYLGCEYNGNNI